MTSSPSGCPVDHASLSPLKTGAPETCPVDHKARSTWADLLPKFGTGKQAGPSTPSTGLSTDREVSTIPTGTEGNWVYPSEAQFFAAMAKKNHNPQQNDMRSIVPIHNAVNERAWAEVMRWEAGRGGEACGGVKLVNFKGKPGERSLKARCKILFGYAPPFDRHDWVVDRCGTKMRYIIDFYTGKSSSSAANAPVSFYLDVRPSFDNWEGVKMRAQTFWSRLLSPEPSPLPPSQTKP